MRPFKYERAATAASAVKAVAGNTSAKYLAGGTNLLDLMKEDVERPNALIDLQNLKLAEISKTSQGVSIGALAKNTETANHPAIRKDYPLLSMAILAGASGQIRNMATNGGNLLQRTRCTYFYDISMPCNKREPGTGCAAMEGLNRMHAIFGWSDKCVAVYPSDMAVGLAALDATVKVLGANGKQKDIPFADFHRLPGDSPEKDTNLLPGDLITGITLPQNNMAHKSYYLKVRDRSSYAFALVSVAVGMETKGNIINKVRIALGGVAHKPWRALEAEKFLKGKTATAEHFQLAADAETKHAKPLEHNKFKVLLANRGIVRALTMANGGTTGESK